MFYLFRGHELSILFVYLNFFVDINVFCSHFLNCFVALNEAPYNNLVDTQLFFFHVLIISWPRMNYYVCMF